jgi:hypothetical protein
MKCRDCQHYKADNDRAGHCLRERFDHPEHGVAYGVAFANEGSADPSDLDCDMAEPRARRPGEEGTR